MKTRKSSSKKSGAKPAPAPAKKAPAKKADVDLESIPAPKKSSPFANLPKGWKPASQALDYVRAVPSIFVDFNRATRIGGIPLRRITTLHGPTHGGKSAFVGGMVRSFLEANHVASYVDAEHAMDLAFMDSMLGRPAAQWPNFFGLRPKTYEEVIDAITDFLKWMVAERKGRFGKKTKTPIPPSEDLAAIQVVDSLNKLVPQRELEKLRKEGGDAIDKGWGRYRAAMNQAFLDHVVPLLGEAETTLAVIVQERGDDDALEPWEMPKLKGGMASQYDASLIIRVMKAKAITTGEGKDKVTNGYKHRVRIWKSKVGHMDGRWSDCHFHLSNGNLVPAGFDLARDLIEVGKELGIVETSGAWYSWNRRRWQGADRAVVSLTEDPQALADLTAAINAKIRKEATE